MTGWRGRSETRAQRLPRAWKATTVRIKRRDSDQCLIRWDATEEGWGSDMDRLDWWGLVAEPVTAAGLHVTDPVVAVVWTRMNRTVRHRDVPTSAGLLSHCAGIAQCVDHIVPRHLLKALGETQTQERVNPAPVEDFNDDVNLQAACLWCNEIKNRFEQLRYHKTPAWLENTINHPGYLR